MNTLRRVLGWVANPVVRTSIRSNTLDGVTYEYWTHWEWTWRLCLPWYTNFWYDGPNQTWSLGVGTLDRYLSDDIHQRRAALTEKATKTFI